MGKINGGPKTEAEIDRASTDEAQAIQNAEAWRREQTDAVEFKKALHSIRANAANKSADEARRRIAELDAALKEAAPETEIGWLDPIEITVNGVTFKSALGWVLAARQDRPSLRVLVGGTARTLNGSPDAVAVAVVPYLTAFANHCATELIRRRTTAP